MTVSKKLKILIALSWVFAVVMMIVIFALSNQPASESQELSDGLIAQIMKLLRIVLPSKVVRKTAHTCEFALLGLILSNAFHVSKIDKWKLGAFLFSVLYACTDEIHQIFIPGRAGRITDVIIDSIGAILGICAYIVIHSIVLKIRSRKNVRNKTV